jgi:hypothetical protein
MKLSKNSIIVKVADEAMAEDPIIQGADLDDDEALEEEEMGKPAKHDPKLDAADPHAKSAKELFERRRELTKQLNELDDQLGKHREVLRALDPKMRHTMYADDKELKIYLRPEKIDDKKKKRKKLDKQAEVDVVDGLLKVAAVLDAAGDDEGVSIVENMLHVFAKKDDGMPHYDVETIEKEKRVYPEYKHPAPSLSTRGCPDHNGILMKRVGEGSFQCMLDGKIYNWNDGFKDYDGNVYPGAPIRSIDMPAIGEKMFENRSMALGKNIK